MELLRVCLVCLRTKDIKFSLHLKTSFLPQNESFPCEFGEARSFETQLQLYFPWPITHMEC